MAAMCNGVSPRMFLLIVCPRSTEGVGGATGWFSFSSPHRDGCGLDGRGRDGGGSEGLMNVSSSSCLICLEELSLLVELALVKEEELLEDDGCCRGGLLKEVMLLFNRCTLAAESNF